MKILQINTVVNSGSTGRIAEDIGHVLLQNGHESYIAYGRGDRPSQSQKIKIGYTKDIYKHGLKTLLFDQHGLGSKKATKDLVKKIDNIQPDVIGLHNIHGYYLNYQILFQYIKSKQIPVLWTFHDCWPFTGHCSYFDSVDCQKWQTHCNKCPLTSNYPKAITDRSFQNFEDKKESFQGVEKLKIVTPSHWLAAQVNKSFLKDYPVEVIHNGIDLSVFKPNEEDFYENENIILGVASTWDERKGLNDFIQLSKTLPPSHQIVLIGLSKKQIENLPGNVMGIERTENIEALVKWYQKAKVFVNPTYVDNFPTTNIEALACGTPVISYNTGGSPEAFDTQTGHTIKKGDMLILAKSIVDIQKDNKTIELCRNRALNCFDAKARYLDYLTLYSNFIKNE
jgi:glycosyltransferase involved in cell wall biosynthesis